MAAVVVLAGLLTGCSGDPATSPDAPTTRSATSASDTSSSPTPSSPATTQPSASDAPADAMTSCSGTVQTHEGTSCTFATNVSEAYLTQVVMGNGSVRAWDPEADAERTMTCVAGRPTICRDGSDVVYIH